jgi:5-methylcytosine-specific restriction endonuclease McrA
VPRAAGGKTAWDNCVTSCKNCNHKKGSKLIRPKVMPYKPDYYSLVGKWREMPFNVKQDSWYQYLGRDKAAA